MSLAVTDMGNNPSLSASEEEFITHCRLGEPSKSNSGGLSAASDSSRILRTMYASHYCTASPSAD